jgi:hypothetical protein
MLEILLGQLPEPIYFALFMIYTKNLKEKRVLFTIFMIIEYFLLKSFIKYNIWFQILYTFITYIILKILYKEKAQITDIFTFGIASLILMFSCIIIYLIIWKTINNFIIYAVLNRLFLILFLFLTRKKLNKIQNIYKKLWNRSKNNNKIKSATFRSLNVIIFNIMFYIINICMLLKIFLNGGV